jgi:D-alanyl-D-alanine carboxypeptidase
MKSRILQSVTLFGLLFMALRLFPQEKRSCDLGITVNPAYSKAARLDSILKKYAPDILPGVSLAVYTESEGWWAGSSGYANRETKIFMQPCHLQYVQSVSKMYMAVEILQLKEQGLLDLDAPLTKYLPSRYAKSIQDASAITIRMLLNHTSGIPEYNNEPGFVSRVMMHPTENFTADDCFSAIAGRKLLFNAGSRYSYSNTNYLILSKIADAITGDHAAYISKHIFEKLGLKNSFYGNGNQYLNGLYLPESYWDILNCGTAANVTALQKMTVACSKGDDGIVCTPVDAVLFLKGLFDGKLLNPASMTEMMRFVKDEKGKDKYSMGMFSLDLGGITAYGHGGGGVGAGCGLIYIPSHKTYLFISTNLGVLVDGKLPEKADALKTEVLMTLLQ